MPSAPTAQAAGATASRAASGQRNRSRTIGEGVQQGADSWFSLRLPAGGLEVWKRRRPRPFRVREGRSVRAVRRRQFFSIVRGEGRLEKKRRMERDPQDGAPEKRRDRSNLSASRERKRPEVGSLRSLNTASPSLDDDLARWSMRRPKHATLRPSRGTVNQAAGQRVPGHAVNSSARNLPVCDAWQAATSSGLPQAINWPPLWPPSGPRSMT